ncbi:hypothetical protein EZV62_019269 [Acer yangbiense]|uniref:CCHC-type domain-containing protein n=1 Tax=Acer yangbiense TaxID=1000413 RepID=A0A5C7H9Y2_9ROSI|nr:hypothetical protein EZV62_019269 [Acer yangbiense]
MESDDISRKCEKLSLDDDNGPIERIKGSLQERGEQSLSLSLIGKAITNKVINREAFKSTISTIWQTKNEVTMELMGINIFKFRFQNYWDRKRILEGGPWLFDKQLLVLREASGSEKVTDLQFRYVPFWIQLHNLPLACLNREIGLHLGGLVGQVKEIDAGESGECVGQFIRIRVLIDVMNPLKRGLRVALGDDEKVNEVMICYERLPNFCYYCGKIGHLVRDCPLNTKEITSSSSFKFGPWMRAVSRTRSKGTGEKKNSPEGSREGGSSDTLENLRVKGSTKWNMGKDSSVLLRDGEQLDLMTELKSGNTIETKTAVSRTMVVSKQELLQLARSHSKEKITEDSTQNSKRMETTVTVTNPVIGENVSNQEGTMGSEDNGGKITNQKRWKRLAREKCGSVNEGNQSLGKKDGDMDIEEYSDRKKISVFTVDRIGQGGGLSLLWKNDIEVSIRSFTKGHIDAVIKDSDSLVWRFTGFYGEPIPSFRMHSWSLLRRLGRMSNLPWIVVGDFNEILQLDEKKGGVIRSNTTMSSFREAVDDCALMDMGYVGNKYTWSNRQFKGELIQERIDRAFCCLEWRKTFP